MSFELSFGPEFFFNEGEPYDGGPGPSEKPTSVWQAIESCKVLDPDKWEQIALDVFNMTPEVFKVVGLTEESVMDKIRETNTCSNLSSPTQVWIDFGGWFTLMVWDK